MILGLDTATHTGWSLLDSAGKLIESGVVSFERRRGESYGSMFLRFRRWLTVDMLDAHPITFVAYERAHHRGGAATEICTNLTGRIQEECEARSIQYAAIPSVTLKKSATGKGKASKEEVMVAASAFAGRQVKDDNEADAIMLAVYAHAEYGV